MKKSSSAAGIRASLVVTTIFEPTVLEQYHANFKKYGHLDQVEVILIADRKTPPSARQACEKMSARGLRCLCPALEEQEKFLRRLGLDPAIVPYDSDNRRNIGYLMALEAGSDFLLSIDDDNYCIESHDFFGEHSIVTAKPGELEQAESATGFLNICEMLDWATSARPYPRGFPYFARHKAEDWKIKKGQADIHVNAGLWLIDPDVDAITWLVSSPRVKGFAGRSLVLGQKSWAPVNTQNTALRREVIPAYYFIRMGYPISGTMIDRYGDIFSGYFAQACVKHLGGAVRFGSPLVDHKRNSHNYLKDAGREWACIVLLEDILPWLREVKLEGKTYSEVFESLSYQLEDAVENFQGSMWSDPARGYFHQVGYHMRAWLKGCRTIQGGK
ncbi:MAG TPA: hypothetical protein VMR90_01515 [Candidatus Cybelea sp.]|nr:hypothetical protein [Candidatus Cybelea sp.]